MVVSVLLSLAPQLTSSHSFSSPLLHLIRCTAARGVFPTYAAPSVCSVNTALLASNNSDSDSLEMSGTGAGVSSLAFYYIPPLLPHSSFLLLPLSPSILSSPSLTAVRRCAAVLCVSVLCVVLLSPCQYDQSVSTFSPNGRVFQVEYAYKAVEKSSTCIGIRCVDGVVLGVEKAVLNKMLVPGSNRRIAAVDYHAAIAMSGMAADARQLVNKARSECNEYQQFYGSPITAKVLADRLGGHIHTHTLYWYLRPFGCAILLAVFDEDVNGGPALYAMEPSGNTAKYFACAIGKMKQGASSELEKLPFTSITCREAVDEIARIIYKLHDTVKEKELELEFSWITKDTQRQVQSVPKDIAAAAVQKAKEAKQREEMEESDDEEESKDNTAAPTTNTTTTTTTTTNTSGSASTPPS